MDKCTYQFTLNHRSESIALSELDNNAGLPVFHFLYCAFVRFTITYPVRLHTVPVHASAQPSHRGARYKLFPRDHCVSAGVCDHGQRKASRWSKGSQDRQAGEHGEAYKVVADAWIAGDEGKKNAGKLKPANSVKVDKMVTDTFTAW